MDVGRVVFSFGNEPLGVVVTAFALRHFGDAEVNLIVGLQLSVEFASNTLCMNLMKAIYGSVFATLHCDAYTAHRCLGVTLALAGVSCLVSVALAWTLVLLDRRIPPNSRNAAMQHGRQSAQSRSTANLPLAAEQSANGRNKSTNSTAVDVETVQNPFNSMVSLSATCSFSVGFWLLGAIGVVYAGTVFQFVSVGVVYFERKYHFSSSEANFCNSLVYVLSAFGCPISGAVVDRIGYNVFWITAGSTLACVGHLLLAFSYVTPYVPVLILGCSYSMLCSAFWSSVGIFVTDQQYGTAIGMIQSLENLALASFALAVGAILDSFGYFAMEIFLLFFAYVSVALSLALLFWSRSTPKLGAVHISAAQRRKQRA